MFGVGTWPTAYQVWEHISMLQNEGFRTKYFCVNKISLC